MITLRRPAAGLASPSTMSKIFDISVRADGFAGDVPDQVGARENGEVGDLFSLAQSAPRDPAQAGVASGLDADVLAAGPVGDDGVDAV